MYSVEDIDNDIDIDNIVLTDQLLSEGTLLQIASVDLVIPIIVGCREIVNNQSTLYRSIT